MTRWRLHVYRQGGEWTEPARDTFAEVRADLERVGPDEDWVYIERQVDDGATAERIREVLRAHAAPSRTEPGQNTAATGEKGQPT
jgi:hypothetical protein